MSNGEPKPLDEMIPLAPTLKTCTTCGVQKEVNLDNFYFTKEGYVKSCCRTCSREKDRARWDNPEYQSRKREYKKRPDQVQKSREYSLKYNRSARVEHNYPPPTYEQGVIPPMKRCTRCNLDKAATVENFYTESKVKGGLAAKCKECHALQVYEYRSIPTVHAARLRQAKVQSKRYYAENRALINSRNRHRSRIYYAKRVAEQGDQFREYSRERTKAYYKTEHGYRVKKAAAARRREWKMSSQEHFTPADVLVQLKTQREKCWYCFCDISTKYEVDHFIPLSKGGSNAADNIVLACPSCNRHKQAKMPWEFSGRLF